MRTTLDIDSDLLQAAKELAALEKTTTGKVITRLARRGLSPGAQLMHPVRNGIEMLPKRDELITLEHVQSILDEEGV
jgi:hypothetical protein